MEDVAALQGWLDALWRTWRRAALFKKILHDRLHRQRRLIPMGCRGIKFRWVDQIPREEETNQRANDFMWLCCAGKGLSDLSLYEIYFRMHQET